MLGSFEFHFSFIHVAFKVSHSWHSILLKCDFFSKVLFSVILSEYPPVDSVISGTLENRTNEMLLFSSPTEAPPPPSSLHSNRWHIQYMFTPFRPPSLTPHLLLYQLNMSVTKLLNSSIDNSLLHSTIQIQLLTCKTHHYLLLVHILEYAFLNFSSELLQSPGVNYA